MNRRAFLYAFGRLAGLCSTGWLAGSPIQAAPLERFKLGIINDEVSYDLEEALHFLKRHRLSWIELRELWQEDHYITALSKPEIGHVKRLLEKYQIEVSVIATYLYKCALPGSELGITQRGITRLKSPTLSIVISCVSSAFGGRDTRWPSTGKSWTTCNGQLS